LLKSTSVSGQKTVLRFLFYPLEQTADCDIIICGGGAKPTDLHLLSIVHCVDEEILDWLERSEAHLSHSFLREKEARFFTGARSIEQQIILADYPVRVGFRFTAFAYCNGTDNSHNNPQFLETTSPSIVDTLGLVVESYDFAPSTKRTQKPPRLSLDGLCRCVALA
jgi:hypothetical protein